MITDYFEIYIENKIFKEFELTKTVTKSTLDIFIMNNSLRKYILKCCNHYKDEYTI